MMCHLRRAVNDVSGGLARQRQGRAFQKLTAASVITPRETRQRNQGAARLLYGCSSEKWQMQSPLYSPSFGTARRLQKRKRMLGISPASCTISNHWPSLPR